MTTDDWNRLRPQRAAGYRLGEAIAVYPERAIFRAQAESGGSPETVVWLLEPHDDEADTTRVNRFLEATFFNHANVLKIYKAGRLEATERPFIYVVSEAFDTTLASIEPLRPLHPDTLRPILLPIAAGLEWLHSQDFVYCGLRPDSVARVGHEWKLADFGELRIAGKSASEETRRLLIRRDLYAPPEAYEGVVSPAWDAWSLGQTIHHLFAQEARAMGRNPRMLEADAGEMMRELLETDPALRLGVAEFARRLREARAVPRPEPRIVDATTSRLTTPERVVGAPARPVVRVPSLPEPHVAATSMDDEESDAPWWKRKNRFATTAAVGLIAGALVILGSIYRNPVVEQPKNERAGSASAPAASEPKPAPKPYAAAAPTAMARPERPTADAASDRREISQLLTRWVDATRNRDAFRQATFYAPRVEEFFGRRNVTATDVRRVRERIFADSNEAREFSIEDVRFERQNEDRAVVSFLKIWNFPGRPFMASAREEMTMKRVDGAWKIAGERELNQTAPRRDTTEREAEAGGDRKTRFTGNQ
jgi:serine/threonine protein kinase